MKIPDTIRGDNKTHKLVKYLIQGIVKEGSHLFVDNYYSSYSLFRDLAQKGIKATGTARIDRLLLSGRQK